MFEKTKKKSQMDNPETRAELGTINRAKTNKMKIKNNRRKK